MEHNTTARTGQESTMPETGSNVSGALPAPASAVQNDIKSLTNRVGTAAIRDIVAQKFWARVTPGASDAHWPWTGPTNHAGKGIFTFEDEGKAHHFLAHRVAYELIAGPIAAGCPVRQPCGCPSCCNPAHLVAEKPRDSIWTLIIEVNASFWADVEEFCLGMRDANKRDKTIKTYKGILRDLTQWLAAHHPDVKSIVDLQRIHTKAYNRALQVENEHGTRSISVQTRAKYMTCIRSMLKYFAQETDLPTMSRDRIRVPKVPQYVPRAYTTPQDVQRLVDTCDRSTAVGRRDAAILALFSASGLRVSELVSLNRSAFPVAHLGTEDIIQARVVRKGGDTGMVLVSRDAQVLLREYLVDRQDTDVPLFTRLRPGRLTARGWGHRRLGARGIQLMLQARLREANLPSNLTPHSLRHGFATDLVENEVGLRQIQQILGHRNITTTEIYTHLSPRVLQAGYLKRTQIDLGGGKGRA